MSKPTKSEAYVPRVKQVGEAQPPQDSYKTTTYRTGDGDLFPPPRPGSLDFLKYKSKGYST